MCATCGCSDDVAGAGDRPAERPRPRRTTTATGTGTRTSRARAPSTLEVDLLAKNDELAARNRRRLAERGIVALNLMSSPGSGKTTLLERTIRDLGGELPCAVLEGDQETLLDAERIGATGARGGADQHRRRLPPRRRHGRRRAARAGPAAGLAAVRGERRQPGLPGAVRPRRARPGS